MIIYREFDTVEQIKKAFSIKTGIIEVTSENHVNFCENEDDAVIIQIGWKENNGFSVDKALAKDVEALHKKLTRFFDGGFHGGITMLVLNISGDDSGYTLLGDDVDDDCDPVFREANTYSELNTVIGNLE